METVAAAHAPLNARRDESFDGALFDRLHVAVAYCSFPERRVLDVNGSYLKLFGLRREDAVGHTTRFMHVDDAHYEQFARVVLPAFTKGEPAEFEFVLRRGDGAPFPCHVSLSPTAAYHGVPIGIVAILRDLTSQKLLETARAADEAELARVRAQLIQGEKLAALGSLVSGVAHELRTPLTFLANNAFLLRARLDLAAKRGASAQEALDESAVFFREMTAGVDRINQLVEDLRRYTRARNATDETLAPLASMIADAVELFRATNRGRFPVETSFSATPPVRANKGALQQLTLNLLQNAAEASAAGQPLRVRTRELDGAVVLEVSDHGAGISPADIARIYDPLFTTKPDGTGLGLSIVKRIVTEHHARIECESVVGSGTTFRVFFPR